MVQNLIEYSLVDGSLPPPPFALDVGQGSAGPVEGDAWGVDAELPQKAGLLVAGQVFLAASSDLVEELTGAVVRQALQLVRSEPDPLQRLKLPRARRPGAVSGGVLCLQVSG